MGNDNTNPTDPTERPEGTEGQDPASSEDTTVDPRHEEPRWAGPHDEAEAGAEPDPDQAPVSTGAAAYGPRPGGVFGAETFSLTAVFLLALTLLSSQIVQLFSTVLQIGDQPVPHDQVAQLTNQTLTGGALALLTLLFAALALLLGNAATRPWARWTAMAAVIMGLLFVLMALLTYVMIPAGSEPQMPQMPSVPQ